MTLQVRKAGRYHERNPWMVTGTDGTGRSVRIHFPSRDEAVQGKARIAAGVSAFVNPREDYRIGWDDAQKGRARMVPIECRPFYQMGYRAGAEFAAAEDDTR